MSDENPSSLALEKVSYLQTVDHGNMTWIYRALTNLFGGNGTSAVEMPTTIPGSTNCIFWWATSDLQGISPPNVEVGVEAMYSIILRLAMQRSFKYEI
jgi:hypothetical protein